MHCKLTGAFDEFIPHSAVKDLGDLVLENGDLLTPTKQLCDYVVPNARHCPEQARELISSIVRQAEISGQISLTESQMFEERIRVFLDHDIKTSGNTRGTLLEYLIYKIGPFAFARGAITRIVRQCQVQNDAGCDIGGSKNIDLGFFDGCQGTLTSYELLECKVNLANFLGSRRSKSKLHYMETIRQCPLGECRDVGFVTLDWNPEALGDRLVALGYGDFDIYAFPEVSNQIACLNGR